MSREPSVSVWILGDQLLTEHPALAAADAEFGAGRVQVVLVESERRIRRRRYHRKKLVLVLSAMRQYADALRRAGREVDYVRAATFADGLRAHRARFSPARLFSMAAADYAGRLWQTRRAEEVLGLPVCVVPNTQFLVGRHDPFPGAARRVILETFYRALRRHFGLLLEPDGSPEGGRWNFDRDNRERLPRDLRPPPPPHFEPDASTREVMDEVERADHGIGSTAGFGYAVTREQARAALADFVANRLDGFGTYQDAMATGERTLYHSVLSPYVNLGLLEPLEMAQAAIDAYRSGRARLNSVEGFVRQVVGWREYMYWQYWRLMPGLAGSNHWKASRPLPAFFWDGRTEMNCLRDVLEGALETGYSHHIERLMVLACFATLAGLDPREVTEWFQSIYVDAHDWVMQPNSVGMGLNADGGQVATKPYVASANYLKRMGDHCVGCRFDPRRRTGTDACPFNTLYWNFLIRNERALRANPRFGPAVLGLRRLTARERSAVKRQAAKFLASLSGQTSIS